MNDYIAIMSFGNEHKIKPVRCESVELAEENLKNWGKRCGFVFSKLLVLTYQEWFNLEGRELH